MHPNDSFEDSVQPLDARRILSTDAARLAAFSLGRVFGTRLTELQIAALVERNLDLMDRMIVEMEVMLGGGRAEVYDRTVLDTLGAHRQGTIICTIHLGPVNCVFAEIARVMPSFALMVSSTNARTRGQHMRAILRQLGADVNILDAGRASDMRRSLRLLREGGTLVTFLDGNTGVGGEMAATRHNLTLELLSHRARVRTGIAHLSRRTGARVVPAIAHWNGTRDRIVEVLNPLEPATDHAADSVGRLTASLWNVFERYIRKYPEQWMGWQYPWRLWDWERGSLGRGEASSGERARELAAIPDIRRADVRCFASPFDVGVFMLTADRAAVIDGVRGRLLTAPRWAHDLIGWSYLGLDVADAVSRMGAPGAEVCERIAVLERDGLLRVIDGDRHSAMTRGPGVADTTTAIDTATRRAATCAREPNPGDRPTLAPTTSASTCA